MTPSHLYNTQAVKGNLKPDTAQTGALAGLDTLAQALAVEAMFDPARKGGSWAYPQGERAPRGLYLYGPVGRGKSMLMQMLFDSVPFKQKRRVHFHSFMQELHDKMHNTHSGGDLVGDIAAEIAADARLLCFDEFYVTNIADGILLGRLLEALFACGITLCATSNWAPDDLYQDGHNRSQFMPFINVLTRNITPCDLHAGQDWRLQVATHHLNSPQAVFAHVSGGLAGRVETLHLPGTALTLEAHVAGKHIRADFAALCARPLGRMAYLDLAGKYTLWVIDNIPPLDGQPDAALRLVTLVDILYENHRPLYLAGKLPLSELCATGPAAGVFRRTLSRAHELQGLLELSLKK